MSTRILENRRNRLTTILIIPLMSCGAKFTVYSLIIPAFFEQKYKGPVMWLVYVIGIVFAVVIAKLLRNTLFKGETTHFVMELPPYRIPTAKGTCIHMWQRGWMYLRKAGTIILMISIVLWFASSYPKPAEDKIANKTDEQIHQITLSNSVIGSIGKTIEPVIRPMGFDWKIGTALIGSFAAKEVFISQLGIVHSIGAAEERKDALSAQLKKNYSPLTGFCILLFILMSTPCMATMAMTKQETNSWRWPIIQYFGLTLLAYIVTVVIYQVGSFLGG